MAVKVIDSVNIIGFDGLILVGTIVVVILVTIPRQESGRDFSIDDLMRVRAEARTKRSPAAPLPPEAAVSPLASGTLVAAPALPPAKRLKSSGGALDGLLRRLQTDRRLQSIPATATGLLVGLALVWIGQNALADGNPPPGAYLLWFAGLLLITSLAWLAGGGHVFGDVSRRPPDAGNGGRWRLTGTLEALFFFVGIASIVIWLDGRDRTSTDRSLDLVALWLLSIASLVIAVAGVPRRRHIANVRAWLARTRTDILLVTGIGILALIPRVYQLNSYPLTMSGDEGIFANSARSVLRGELRNPFFTGFWGYPTFIFVVQSWIMRVAGDSVAGARLFSAVLGAGSVIAIYCLTSHLLGRWTALIAAVLASAFHFHLFYSRNTQVPIAPTLFVPLALLFLDRGLIGRRRTDSLIAGLVIAVAQFTHPACVILYPLAALYAVYAFAFGRPTTRSSLRASFAGVAPQAMLVAVGGVIGQLPLLAYFYGHPDQYGVRSSQVSVFASGWLEREQEITGKGPVEILWIQFRNAALLPFETLPRGFYRPEPPFVGWPLAVPIAIGLAIATLAFWKRSYFGPVAAFWASVAGLAITEGPPQTNRYVSAVPFLLIFAAIGIVAIVRIAVGLVRLPRFGAFTLAAAVTLLIAGWHLHYYFRDENQVEIYSDVNSEIAGSLAREADSHGSGLTVYFSGAPRLTMAGFNSVSFIADEANRIDVIEPWTANDTPPALTGPTLFGFVPERLAELDVVRAWFPNGMLRVSTLPNGEEILITYFVDAPVVEPARGHVIVPSA